MVVNFGKGKENKLVSAVIYIKHYWPGNRIIMRLLLPRSVQSSSFMATKVAVQINFINDLIYLANQ